MEKRLHGSVERLRPPHALFPAACLLTVWLLSGTDKAQPLKQTDVFVSGADGYLSYRIPALVVTNRGTLLAFSEAERRKPGPTDHGDIDLVLKRSTDAGRSWSRQQVVYAEGGSENITIGNPAPVVDRDNGIVWLAFCRNNRDVFITQSQDDGKTWVEPRRITQDVKKPDWDWYATGPGSGIQLRSGPNKGRLVIPCDHIVGAWHRDMETKGRSHVIYSDDHGKTWKPGQGTDYAMNEGTIVELVDGALMLNMRSYRGKNRRAVAISKDGGLSWSASSDDATLVEAVCQASILRYTWPDQNGKSRILFSNPASTTRDHLTVRLSYDDGKTWPISKLLHEGPSAYSNLAVLSDGSIACLYERGAQQPYERITFARFTLDRLTDGLDRLTDGKDTLALP